MAANTAPLAMSPSQPQSPSSSRASASAPGRAPCPLLRLPAELLQQIYYYLPLGTPSYPRLLARNNWMQAAPSDATPALQTPPLARTCRRLRADVLALYLGDLRVDLCDSNELDGVFLERCLRALGSAVLHVTRLTIEHKVDICIDEKRRDVVRNRAETVFEVKGPPAGEGSEALAEVEVTCSFKRTTLLGDDRLPAERDLCDCPISTHLLELSNKAQNSNQTTQTHLLSNNQDQKPTHPSSTSHAQIFPSPLTSSVLNFLALLDTTSSVPELETRPRYQQRSLSSGPKGWWYLDPIVTLIPDESSPYNPKAKWWPWPLCSCCKKKRYLPQGPVTGPYLRKSRSLSDSSRELQYVNYAGHRWISCPNVPAKQSAQTSNLALDKDSNTPVCRWGPARPRLVRPYGAKSRALLRQERDLLLS